jgi:hypothetical protein
MLHKHQMLVLVAVGLMSIAGCKQEGPTEPKREGCQSTTGTIVYTNNKSRPILIKIDGTTYGYVSPGESKSFVVAAGVSHTLQKFYDSGSKACNDSFPSVSPCQTLNLSCG